MECFSTCKERLQGRNFKAAAVTAQHDQDNQRSKLSTTANTITPGNIAAATDDDAVAAAGAAFHDAAVESNHVEAESSGNEERQCNLRVQEGIQQDIYVPKKSVSVLPPGLFHKDKDTLPHQHHAQQPEQQQGETEVTASVTGGGTEVVSAMALSAELFFELEPHSSSASATGSTIGATAISATRSAAQVSPSVAIALPADINDIDDINDTDVVDNQPTRAAVPSTYSSNAFFHALMTAEDDDNYDDTNDDENDV